MGRLEQPMMTFSLRIFGNTAPKPILPMLLLAALSVPGESLRLDDALALSVRHPDVVLQTFDVRSAEGDSLTAGLRPNPVLNLNGDAFSTASPYWDPQAKMFGASLAATLELGGKRRSRRRAADSALAAVRAQGQDTRTEAALAVGFAWLNAAQAKWALQTARQAEASLDSTAAVDQVRLHARIISEVEALRSRISARQAEQQREEAEIALAGALRDLNLALNTDTAVDVREQDGFAYTPPPLDSCLFLAHARRDDLATARAEAASAQADLAVQQSLAFPDVTVSADYSRQQDVPFYGFSLSLPLPLARNQGERFKARAQWRRAQVEAALALKKADAEVASSYAEYAERRRGLEEFGQALEESEKVRAAMEHTYRSGNTSILDFLDAQRNWYDVQQSFHDATADYERACLRLSAAIGAILTDHFSPTPR